MKDKVREALDKLEERIMKITKAHLTGQLGLRELMDTLPSCKEETIKSLDKIYSKRDKVEIDVEALKLVLIDVLMEHKLIDDWLRTDIIQAIAQNKDKIIIRGGK